MRNRLSSEKLITRFIEYNIVEHCNLRCFQCDHGSPILPPKFIRLQDFRADLEELSKVLYAQKLKIIGGEPLLHPELLEFITLARRIGIASTVAVITNGTLLHKVNNEFWDNIDELQVTCYAGVNIKTNFEDLEMLARKKNIVLNVIKRDLFRYTTLSKRNNDNNLVKRIYDKCELRTIHHCHTVRDRMYYTCSPAPFVKDRLFQEGIIYNDMKNDGVPVHDNPNLKESLKNYFNRSKPLSACHYCLGTVGHNFPHVQMTQVTTEIIRKLNNPLELINFDLLD